MDSFDYIDQTQPTRSVSGLVWNVLTVLVLLLVVCVGAVFAIIFISPQSNLNLFPPATLPAAIELPTITPTARVVLPPTWTPLPTLQPTATETPRPTRTPFPTETPFSLFTATSTLETTAPATGGFSFEVAPGSPVAISSVTFKPEQGCNWMGVAGQVLDMSNAPISTGVIIQLSGVLGGKFFDIPSLTAVAQQYGPAGYEITLGDKPLASNKTLWVQLLDQAGIPMSDKIYFATYNDCEKNLVFINFKQVR